MKEYRIGCSGWSYGGWVGKFYPSGIRPDEMLSYYSKAFSSVEIDMTFYRTPSSDSIDVWNMKTPPDFIFASKMNRYVTHFRKLKGVKEQVLSFISRMKELGNKMGPDLATTAYLDRPGQ